MLALCQELTAAIAQAIAHTHPALTALAATKKSTRQACFLPCKAYVSSAAVLLMRISSCNNCRWDCAQAATPAVM